MMNSFVQNPVSCDQSSDEFDSLITYGNISFLHWSWVMTPDKINTSSPSSLASVIIIHWRNFLTPGLLFEGSCLLQRITQWWTPSRGRWEDWWSAGGRGGHREQCLGWPRGWVDQDTPGPGLQWWPGSLSWLMIGSEIASLDWSDMICDGDLEAEINQNIKTTCWYEAPCQQSLVHSPHRVLHQSWYLMMMMMMILMMMMMMLGLFYISLQHLWSFCVPKNVRSQAEAMKISSTW